MNEDLFYVSRLGDVNVRTEDGPRLIAFSDELSDPKKAAYAIAGRLSILAELGLITIHADALKLEV